MILKSDLPLSDKLLVSLALMDWEQARALNPEHALFGTDTVPLQVNKIYGAFPTQAEGQASGVPFYFRARHGAWTLDFGQDPIKAPELTLSGDDPSAGMMEDADVLIHLRRGARVIAFLRSPLKSVE